MRLVLLAITIVALTAPVLVGSTTADHPNTVPCLTNPVRVVDDPTGLAPSVACPDLIVDAARFNERIEVRSFSATHCDVREGSTVAGTRTLLRFTFTTPNVGAADLVVGDPGANPDDFEWGACHGHYHFKEYADYRLWTPEQFAAWDALRAANPDAQAHEILAAHPELTPTKGEKAGFCVIDLIPYSPLLPAKWVSCGMQGISVGWADEYYWGLSGQYVDITGLPGGQYVLEAEVNAEQVYEESSYANNRAWKTVTI